MIIPLTYRERWLATAIKNNATLPRSIGAGHDLALTGTMLGATTDGVHFTGGATSSVSIADNAGQDGKAACHITIRFKLDKAFPAGAAGNFYLLNKVDGTTYIRIYLKQSDGKLYWEQDNGAGGAGFSLTSTTASWAAGTWYIITVSLDDTPAQRLLVNGSVQDTDTSAAVVTPTGGSIIIGNSSPAGASGFVGTIAWVVMGFGATATIGLTTDEEIDLSNGAPPRPVGGVASLKIQYMLLLDEGRGVTVSNRGNTAPTTGTLDTACTWVFGQVKQPCVSMDGYNDLLASAGWNIDISGDFSMTMVVRFKNTQAVTLPRKQFLQLSIDGDNYIEFLHPASTLGLQLVCRGSGTSATASYATGVTIGDYCIYTFTLTTAGTSILYANGTQIATATGSGIISHDPASVHIGSVSDPNYWNNDQILEVLTIEGVLTAAQVKIYAKYLRDRKNLPIVI